MGLFLCLMIYFSCRRTASRRSVGSVLSCFGQISGMKANRIKKNPEKSRLLCCTRQDSNLRPFGPEPNALSPELRVRKGCVPARFSILHGIVENVNSFPLVSFRQKPLHFKQSLPKAAARFHRHTGEWYGQKKICRSLPY